jgi:hypothetical protein
MEYDGWAAVDWRGFFYLGRLCFFAGVFVKNVFFSVVFDGEVVVI